MDPKHKEILTKMRPKIVHDLDLKQIIDVLLSEGIVNDSLWQKIQSERSNESQNQLFLDELRRRGPNAYSGFKEAMRNHYHWISEEMDRLDTTEDCVDALAISLAPTTLYPYLPANPPLSVKRMQKTEQLRNGLRNLEPGNYLTLHAFQGYGKSTLASATLKDKALVAELFQNEVYWIKFSHSQSPLEYNIIQLNLLYHQVRNLDYLNEPTNEDSLKYFLRHHFAKHSHALLVLDDVVNREVIEAFDFGCKTLVLTADTDILIGKQNTVIQMCEGFSLDESRNLFAEALDISVTRLPHQATQIHDECKGMPLIIAMYAALFKDVRESLLDENTSAERWSYYRDALHLQKSDVLQAPLEKLAKIFDIFISKLSQNDQDYYKTLAIFPEDVNITTKTLSIFWGIKPAEVELRMLRFGKKSLACREWHEHLKTYIYGVHNLLLCHLRGKLRPNELKMLHQSYVQKNLKECNKDYSKLPTDNYIHSYIGYHMEKGELNIKFSDLYLDFGFIEAKIFHVGPGDLLIDLKKYRNYITQDATELEEKVEDLEKFLIEQAPTLAEYRRRKCLDLVQVALKHPSPGFVRETAEALAIKRPSILYLNHLKHNPKYSSSYSQELHLQVWSVAFINDANLILVGDDKGNIVSWNCNSGQHSGFFGNSRDHPITKIVVPVDGKFFISISGDGTAKLFDFQYDTNKCADNHVKTLPPRVKQSNWKDLSSQTNQDDSRMTFSIPHQKIIDIAISNDGSKIAACTNAGHVAMWNSSDQVLIEPKKVGRQTPLTSIAFAMCDMLLHTISESTGSMMVLEASNANYKAQFNLQPETDKIISLHPVPDYTNLLILLLEKKVYRIRWANGMDTYSQPQIHNFAELTEKKVAYTCAAITWDGKYIVTADTSGSINICNIHKKFELVRTYKHLVSSLDTYWLRDKGCHIICGGNRDTMVPLVHRWKFDPEERLLVRRLPLFDATMEPGERNVIAVTTSNRTVQIIRNDIVMAETPVVTGKITSLVISDNKNHIFYATDSGSVYLFDIKQNLAKAIMHLSGSVEFIMILKIDNNDVIVCEEGGDNLQIWSSKNGTQLVENSGAVIFCDLINSVKCVLTVADTVVKFWHPQTWRLQSRLVPTNVAKIDSCALSITQTFLAVANCNGNLNVLKLVPRQDVPGIQFEVCINQKFPEGITACSFSNDEQYLAFGSMSGDITIISMQTTSEIHKLQLHRRPVKQLYWSPSHVKEHILLSLTNELALWNVSPKDKKRKMHEISHSLSELTVRSEMKQSNSGPKIRTSKSLELGSTQPMVKASPNEILYDDKTLATCSSSNSETDITQSLMELNGNDLSSVPSLWSSKKPKFSNIPGLLSVVKLDGELATKVCISNDFNDFVTINGEGSIYNLTIFEPTTKDNINGNR